MRMPVGCFPFNSPPTFDLKDRVDATRVPRGVRTLACAKGLDSFRLHRLQPPFRFQVLDWKPDATLPHPSDGQSRFVEAKKPQFVKSLQDSDATHAGQSHLLRDRASPGIVDQKGCPQLHGLLDRLNFAEIPLSRISAPDEEQTTGHCLVLVATPYYSSELLKPVPSPALTPQFPPNLDGEVYWVEE